MIKFNNLFPDTTPLELFQSLKDDWEQVWELLDMFEQECGVKYHGHAKRKFDYHLLTFWNLLNNHKNMIQDGHHRKINRHRQQVRDEQYKDMNLYLRFCHIQFDRYKAFRGRWS